MNTLLGSRMMPRGTQIVFKQQIRLIVNSVFFSHSSDGQHAVFVFLHGYWTWDRLATKFMPRVKFTSSQDDVLLFACCQSDLR